MQGMIKNFIFISLGVAIFSISIQACAYIDEYNNYNANPNYNNGSYGGNNTTPGGAPGSTSPQGLQGALQVFQDVDCEHLGCSNNKKDFFEHSGSKSTAKTFQITPSDSSSDSSSGANSGSS